jgi:hypothetical protein
MPEADRRSLDVGMALSLIVAVAVFACLGLMGWQSRTGFLVGATFGILFVLTSLLASLAGMAVATTRSVQVLLAILCSYLLFGNPRTLIVPTGPRVTGPTFWLPGDDDEEDEDEEPPD